MSRIPYEEGAYYVFDGAYMDTKKLHSIQQKESFYCQGETKLKYVVDNDCDYNYPETG